MNIKADFSGFNRLSKNIQQAKNTTTMNQDDLFPDDWIDQHTDVATWYEFHSRAPWEGAFDDETVEELRNQYISQHSQFENWEDMINVAATDAIERLIFKGL